MELSPIEYCARHKIVFATNKGMLTVVDLWDLPLTSETGKPNLNDVAKSIHANLRKDETNFVEFEEKSPMQTGDTMALEAVKRVIAVKQAERKAAATAREKSEQKQKILALMAERKDADLKALPMEKLQELLAAL